MVVILGLEAMKMMCFAFKWKELKGSFFEESYQKEELKGYDKIKMNNYLGIYSDTVIIQKISNQCYQT